MFDGIAQHLVAGLDHAICSSIVLMSDEGKWRAYGPFNQPAQGMELRVGSVFYAEIVFREASDGFNWHSILNNLNVGRHKTMEEGMARIDWEIWNRVRLMIPAYREVKARADSARQAT